MADHGSVLLVDTYYLNGKLSQLERKDIMSNKIVQLIRQNRKQDIWNQYCGFLDLSLEEFMKVQERLLLEQLSLVSNSVLGKKILSNDNWPTSVKMFRATAPLTTYEDYASTLLEKREDDLAMKPFVWARTSGRSGSIKLVPYSREMYDRAGDRILAAFILAMASERGEVRLEERDVLVYNAPPAPYASGVGLLSLIQLFPFHFVPSAEETEALSFHERLELSFQVAMVTGIDVLGSITSVLVKIGERFAQGASSAQLSRYFLHPKALFRLGRGLMRSRLAGRPMLPKDLWTVKGVTCGGTDTSLYKEKIIEYWGVTPHEIYASTEAGVITAVHAWDRKGLYFFPDDAFYEFIPEQEWTRNRQDPSYQPSTVLLDEVKMGQRYELVITSFFGGPFLRYRMGDLVRFISLTDDETNIQQPSMFFSGRSDGLIDLASFTGPMDESLIWQAIHDTGVSYEDWTVRKEKFPEGAKLHIYIELNGDVSAEEMRQGFHDNLKTLNPFYADMETMLEVNPILVTLLSPGTFRSYALEKMEEGADLAHLKPVHMNGSDESINALLRLSEIEGKKV